MRLTYLSFRRCLVLALFIWLIFIPEPGHAQTPSGNSPASVTLTAQAGFDAYFKGNHWIPVFITLENSGPDLEGRVEVRIPRTNGGEDTYQAPVSLGTTSRKLVELDVYPGSSYISSIDVSFYTGNQRIAQTSVRVTSLPGQTDLLFGVVSGNPSAFNILTSLSPANGKANLAQIDPAFLPTQARSLESLDLLIFDAVDTGELTSAQQQALGGWLASGGQLLIAGGPDWQKTAAGLGNFLPFDPQGTQTISSLSALQAYVGSSTPMVGDTILTTGTAQAKAQVLVAQDGMPLLVRQSFGAGSIVYLAFDPSLTPLKNWDGLELLYRNLIAGRADLPAWSGGIQDWSSAYQAATNLPNQNLPSGFLLCGFLVFYVVAIGPVNYMILKRLKRRELAWFSIPVLVILFSGLAFLLGSRARGYLPILNRLAVVQVYPGVPQARIDGMIGVFSPSRDTYRLDFRSNLSPHSADTGYPNSRPLTILQSGNTNSADRLFVDVGGITPVAFQGQTQAPDFESNLRLATDGSDTRLEGTITNRSNLTLQDAVFLAPGHSQSLGLMKPGDAKTVQITLDVAQRSGTANSKAFMSSYPGVVYASPPYPYYGMDTTVQDIVGTQNYYNNQDYYRRFSLVSAILGMNQGGGRGGGFYLAGWTDSFPEEMTLYSGSRREFDTADHSLYLVSFQPQIQATGKEMAFSPGAFTWAVLDGSPNMETSPYNTYVYSPGMTLQFDLTQQVKYSAIHSLTLHLQGSSNPTQLVISLWDYQTGSWQIQTIQQYGDYTLPDPERFLGPGSQIRLKIAPGPTMTTEMIQRADFTLVLNP
jgi:hypothetical protein